MWTDPCGKHLHSSCPDKHEGLLFFGLREEVNFVLFCFPCVLCDCSVKENKMRTNEVFSGPGKTLTGKDPDAVKD